MGKEYDEGIERLIKELKRLDHIDIQDLLEDIAPLLGDYFIVETEVKEGKINLSFYNGQTFYLYIKEQE